MEVKFGKTLRPDVEAVCGLVWTATGKNARKEVFVNQDKQCVASLRMIGHMQKKVIFLSWGLTWAPRILSKNTSEQETNWTTLLDFF